MFSDSPYTPTLRRDTFSNSSGKLNFPRLTTIGPFTDKDATQEFNREITQDYKPVNVVHREVGNIHNIDFSQADRVKSKLIVREEVPDSSDSILGEIERQVNIATRDNIVAEMNYWAKDDIAGIIDITVDESFRRMGIATKLKMQELDYMNSEGAEIVYTDVISEGGYRLAKTTGFEPIYRATHLEGTESVLTFNNNRGVMFKYI